MWSTRATRAPPTRTRASTRTRPATTGSRRSTPSAREPPRTSLATSPRCACRMRPGQLTAEARGRSAIELDWTRPSSSGTSPVTGYRIEWSSTRTGRWRTLKTNTRSTTTRYTDTGLSPGTTRYYRVAAISAAGTSTWSNVADATTDDLTVPGVPTSLRATTPGGVAGSDRIVPHLEAPVLERREPDHRLPDPNVPQRRHRVGHPRGRPHRQRPPPTCTPVSPPTRPGSIAWPRSTPRGRGTTRAPPEARPGPHGPASPGTCARARRDRPASPSTGRRRPATAGSGSPATPFGSAAPTTAPGSRSSATRVRRRPPSRTRASSRQPPTGTRWRRSTAWEPASGRSRRRRARTPTCPTRRRA